MHAESPAAIAKGRIVPLLDRAETREAAIAKRTLDRAKTALGVVSAGVNDGNEAHWSW